MRAGHFRKPEVAAGENAKDRHNAHNHVEVSNHEVSAVELDIEGRLRQEKSADAGGNEHGNKAQREETRCVEAKIGSIDGTDPNHGDDGGRNGYDQGRERENQSGKRIHPAQEHVMAPYHVAEKAACDHAGVNDLDAQDKQRSGYEVLPSNGRLENDALDRVQDTLDGNGPSPSKSDAAPTPKYNLSLGPALPVRSAAGPGATKDSRPPAAVPSPGSITEEEIQDLRKKRVAAEKRTLQLNNALQNLQELYDNQTKSNDLVAIKKTGTPVYSRPEEAGKPLFTATAKDQFQMVEIKGEWVHVQIAGQSRGWIRKAQLEFPDDLSVRQSVTVETRMKSTELFRIVRESMGIFAGNWGPLRGKPVKVYSVQPAQVPTGETAPGDKLAFAEEIFVKAWKEQSAASPPPSGIVVVFDSADGGQVSTTVESLQAWQEGKISEEGFWHACSLDPRETFAVGANKP